MSTIHLYVRPGSKPSKSRKTRKGAHARKGTKRRKTARKGPVAPKWAKALRAAIKHGLTKKQAKALISRTILNANLTVVQGEQAFFAALAKLTKKKKPAKRKATKRKATKRKSTKRKATKRKGTKKKAAKRKAAKSTKGTKRPHLRITAAEKASAENMLMANEPKWPSMTPKQKRRKIEAVVRVMRKGSATTVKAAPKAKRKGAKATKAAPKATKAKKPRKKRAPQDARVFSMDSVVTSGPSNTLQGGYEEGINPFAGYGGGAGGYFGLSGDDE